MNLRLNPKRRLPIYAQIVDGVRHMVATGELRPGQQLPTVRSLAAQLHVNANTVARAYDLLDEAGVISTQQGRGCYIAERPNAEQIDTHRRRTLHTLIDHTLLEALSLGYSTSEVETAFARQLEQWQQEQGKIRRRST